MLCQINYYHTVFVNCLLKEFAIFLREVTIFLLNVMVQFCGVGAALLAYLTISPFWYEIEAGEIF